MSERYHVAFVFLIGIVLETASPIAQMRGYLSTTGVNQTFELLVLEASTYLFTVIVLFLKGPTEFLEAFSSF